MHQSTEHFNCYVLYGMLMVFLWIVGLLQGRCYPLSTQHFCSRTTRGLRLFAHSLRRKHNQVPQLTLAAFLLSSLIIISFERIKQL